MATPATCHSAIRRGELASLELGGCRRILRRDLAVYVAVRRKVAVWSHRQQVWLWPLDPARTALQEPMMVRDTADFGPPPRQPGNRLKSCFRTCGSAAPG